jgi:lysophospholipase L1-like esterase
MPVVAVTIAASVGLVLAFAAVVRDAVRRMRRAASALNETIPVNSAWWRARAKERGDILYVALGDSAAQGLGASAPAGGYVGVLAARIDLLSGRSVRTVNLSVSGATVAQLIDYQLPRLAKLEPDIVTVAIGANDIARWDARTFARDLATVFDALPSHAIVGDLPYFYLPWNERKVAEANLIVRRLAAERGLAVAPVHRATLALGPLGALLWFAGDHFHPNDRGYKVWASAFDPLVARRVARLSTAAPSAPDSTSPSPAEGRVGGAP